MFGFSGVVAGTSCEIFESVEIAVHMSAMSLLLSTCPNWEV